MCVRPHTHNATSHHVISESVFNLITLSHAWSSEGESGLLWQSMCCVTATGFIEHRPEACFYHTHMRAYMRTHTRTYARMHVHVEAGRNDKDLCAMTGGYVDRQGDKPSRQDYEAERVTNCMVHFHIANLWVDTSGRNSHVQSEPSRQSSQGNVLFIVAVIQCLPVVRWETCAVLNVDYNTPDRIFHNFIWFISHVHLDMTRQAICLSHSKRTNQISSLLIKRVGNSARLPIYMRGDTLMTVVLDQTLAKVWSR